MIEQIEAMRKESREELSQESRKINIKFWVVIGVAILSFLTGNVEHLLNLLDLI